MAKDTISISFLEMRKEGGRPIALPAVILTFHRERTGKYPENLDFNHRSFAIGPMTRDMLADLDLPGLAAWSGKVETWTSDSGSWYLKDDYPAIQPPAGIDGFASGTLQSIVEELGKLVNTSRTAYLVELAYDVQGKRHSQRLMFKPAPAVVTAEVTNQSAAA